MANDKSHKPAEPSPADPEGAEDQPEDPGRLRMGPDPFTMGDTEEAPPELVIEQLMSQAVPLQQTGRLEQALMMFRQVLDLKPDHAQALTFAGFTALDLGKTEEGIGMLLRAAALRPNDEITLMRVAEALTQSGQLAEGVSIFGRLMDMRPEDEKLRCEYGLALAQNGQVEDGLKEIDAVLKNDPRFALGIVNTGIAYEARGDKENALNAYREALALAPSDALVARRLAERFSEHNLLDAAEAACQNAAMADSGALLCDLARIQFKAGKVPEAVHTLRKATEMRSWDAEPYEVLAEILIDVGHFEDAVLACERGLSCNPNSEICQALMAEATAAIKA